MTIHIPNYILQFAGGEDNLGVYKMFVDYFNHFRSRNGAKNVEFQKFSRDANGQSVELSFDEKEARMNAALRKEIVRLANVGDITNFSAEMMATNPMIKWATFAVVSALIDLIMPQTMIDTIGIYSDVRSIGWGDSASFDVKPRDLFVVSKAGRAKRTAELRKQFEGQVTILPEPRQISVYVSLYKVRAGKESLADFVMKAVRSVESQMTVDVYNTFATAMDAISNTANTGLRVAGYTQDEFVRLAQTVTAWNNGAKPIAIGTQRALANILPADANYRYDFDSEYVRVGYLKNFQGTDIMVLPQVADWETPFGLKLSDQRIWMVSPSAQKLVKVVLEGATMAYTDDVYKNANLMQTSTLVKSWGQAVVTNAVAATIDLS